MEKNNMISKIKLSIFDMDGVLTETSKQHYLAWKYLCDKIGIDFDENFNENLKGVSRMVCLDLLLQKGNMLDRYGEEEKVQLATEKNEYYKKLIEEFTPANISPGAKELIITLRNNNVKIALASASMNAVALLKSMEIYDLFDYIVDPASLKKGKPDPEIFILPCLKLNIKPENSIGFEDAAAGIQAIKSANIFAIGIGDKNTLAKADVIYTDIELVNLEEIERMMVL
jgi:beta-phosphoglucomutase